MKGSQIKIVPICRHSNILTIHVLKITRIQISLDHFHFDNFHGVR